MWVNAQLLSHIRLFATPWTAPCQTSLFITNSQSLLKLMSIQSVMPSNHLILCRPLLLQPSILFSIRVFCNKTVLIRWPEYWSFSFSICPSNEYSGLISFRMDWWSPCSPTNCQQSSPTPQFKTIHPSMGTGYFLFYLLETIQLPCTFIFANYVHSRNIYWASVLCQKLFWLLGTLWSAFLHTGSCSSGWRLWIQK